MGRLLIAIFSFVFFIYVEREDIKNYVISSIEKTADCKLIGAEFFLPNKLYVEQVLSDKYEVEKTWISITLSGVGKVSAKHVKFILKDEEPKTLDQKLSEVKNLPGVLKEVFEQLKRHNFTIPSLLLVEKMDIGDRSILDLCFSKSFAKFDIDFWTAYSKDQDLHIKSFIDISKGAFTFDVKTTYLKKPLGVFLDGVLKDFKELDIGKAVFSMDDSEYDFKGKFNLQDLRGEVSWRDVLVHAEYNGKINCKANGFGLSVDSEIDPSNWSVLFSLYHADEILRGVYNEGKFKATSDNFFGISGIVIKTDGDKFECESNVSEHWLSGMGTISLADGVLKILIDNGACKSPYLNATILESSYFSIDRVGIRYAFPKVIVKSDILEFISNIKYRYGDLSGYIDVKRLKPVIPNESPYTGRVSFSNIEDRKIVRLNGKLENNHSVIEVATSSGGTDITATLYKSNKINVTLPLFIYPTNKLYDFSVNGTKFNIKFDSDVKNFVSQENISGDIIADVKGEVVNDKVAMSGDLLLDNVLIAFHRYGVVFKGVKIAAKFDGDKILIIRSRIQDIQGGSAHVSGAITVAKDKITPDLKMSFSRMCLSDDGALNLIGTGYAKVSGDTFAGIIIGGEINCSNSRFKMLGYQNDYQDIDVLHVYDDFSKPEKQDPLFKIIFDVSLACPDLKIESDMIKSKWHGNLKLCGENTPTLEGTLNVTDGKLYLFKKDLNITSGKIKFLRKYPFNPTLFLQASRNLSDMLVDIKVSKDVSKADFSITSVPEKSMEDILAKLLFDKNAEEMSATDWAQVGYIIQNSKKGNFFSLIDEAMSKLRISDVRFDKKNEDDKGTIKLSSKLGERAYVSLESDIDENDLRVKVKTDVTENVSLEASSNGDLGVAYRHRY